MSQTWHSDDPDLKIPAIGVLGFMRLILRGAPLAVLVFGGLLVLLLMRMIERPLFGMNRPFTPYFVQWICRNALRILGIGLTVEGQLMTGRGAIVANHSSWLDIFSLNALGRHYFVSKSEVAGWAGIGWLARATGTVFIRRDPREARTQTVLLQQRLLAGHRLLFFPEGTSTDSRRVLPFKTSLFAAFFAETLRPHMSIQPASVAYIAPKGEDARFYGWWGDMSFGASLAYVLAQVPQGRIHIKLHDPIRIKDVADRKVLAKTCETRVRGALDPFWQD